MLKFVNEKMKDIKWLTNRVKSMSVPEVIWRLQQKCIQKYEYRNIYKLHMPVTKIPIAGSNPPSSDYSKLVINWDNQQYSVFETLDLFESYDYYQYKKSWNAGFQTPNKWPEEDFSYSISIGQREDIGDIRINWELNRHYQFVCLAKSFYITLDNTYLEELKNLFEDWNKHNLFLHGVEWASAMEVGIRMISWIYSYAFLTKAAENSGYNCTQILNDLQHGIYVMANYILKHRAQYSSANNHLIIEMCAVTIAGIFFDKKMWVKKAVRILTKELPRQNSRDGVNKEMSLHYQSFVMEAYGLLIITLKKNNLPVPEAWMTYLSSQAKFVADCCGDYGEVVVFGDSDEGKILDFKGKIDDYYRYVLQLMGMIFENRYTESSLNENIHWLFNRNAIEKYEKKELYSSDLVCCYKDGGYTLLRSSDRKMLIGIDHADLGFGSISAHGHADALSIQMFYGGVPILIDSGTYSYHVPKSARNEFRSTKAHNTVYVENTEQAEIQGPFLWGGKYRCTLHNLKVNADKVDLIISVNYKQIMHIRYISYNYNNKLVVKDELSVSNVAYQLWHLGESFHKLSTDETIFASLTSGVKMSIFASGESMNESNCYYSDFYGKNKKGRLILVKLSGSSVTTNIIVEKGYEQ